MILAGSTKRLEAGFDSTISSKFEYIYFAEDDEKKENGEVVPGIGGSVYELLGIGSSVQKNSFIPELISTRRARFHSSP